MRVKRVRFGRYSSKRKTYFPYRKYFVKSLNRRRSRFCVRVDGERKCRFHNFSRRIVIIRIIGRLYIYMCVLAVCFVIQTRATRHGFPRCTGHVKVLGNGSAAPPRSVTVFPIGNVVHPRRRNIVWKSSAAGFARSLPRKEKQRTAGASHGAHRNRIWNAANTIHLSRSRSRRSY